MLLPLIQRNRLCSTTAYRAANRECVIKSKGGKALGASMFSLSTGAQIDMAINASTGTNSAVKAADGSSCSQRPCGRDAAGFSPEEIGCPGEGRAAAAGAARPDRPSALLILQRDASGRESTWGTMMDSLGTSLPTRDNEGIQITLSFQQFLVQRLQVISNTELVSLWFRCNCCDPEVQIQRN